jgi:hypothetical protein
MAENTGEKKIKLLSEEELSSQWASMSREAKDEACLYQNIPLAFIRSHVREINWPNLSVNHNVTFEILDAYSRKISWKSICVNAKKLSDTFLYNYRLRLEWYIVLEKQQLEAEILVRLAEAFRKSSLRTQKEKFWKAISKFQEMDIPFIDAYRRYIDMRLLSANKMIPEEVLQKYIDELDVEVLLTNRTDHSKEFLTKNYMVFLKSDKIKAAIAKKIQDRVDEEKKTK